MAVPTCRAFKGSFDKPRLPSLGPVILHSLNKGLEIVLMRNDGCCLDDVGNQKTKPGHDHQCCSAISSARLLALLSVS